MMCIVCVVCFVRVRPCVRYRAGYILMSPTATSPHPLRALGALGRYASYALLILAALRTK